MRFLTAVRTAPQWGAEGRQPTPTTMEKDMRSQNIGIKPISDGQTVLVDHTIRTFTVSVRSMNDVGANTIKDLIEKKFEVVSIEETDCVHMVKGS